MAEPKRNGLLGYAQMSPTPRNKLMGLLADALGGVNDYANKTDPAMPGGLANPPLSAIAGLLSLPSLAKTADRMSYGDPLTNAKTANVPWLKPETADALMMAPLSPRNALAAASLGMGADTGAARAIFAGITAKTADKAALAKAEKLAASGADPKAIWRDTGWFKGGDGKWRFEIDDSASKMSGVDPSQATVDAFKSGGVPAMMEMRDRLKDYVQPYRRTDYRNELGNVFEHGPLDKAYPDVMPYTGYRGMDTPIIGEGYYSPKTNTIGLSPINEEGARSGMLHELQHLVQEREGFSKGGSPELMREEALRMLRRDVGSGEIESTERAMSMLPMYQQNAYQRLAGEAEARAVQKRLGLTEKQRRDLFPLDSYDVPINSLIYR